MNVKPGIQVALRMVPGAVIMLVIVLVLGHFQKGQDPAKELAFKAQRVDLVSRIQLGLSSASEAEKSAVMAMTDKESKVFADQARAATAEVERERRDLKELLDRGGNQAERELLGRFAQAFTEFQRIDSELLGQAIKNTNLKAYTLAFGPAADALDEMNRALSRIVAANADSPEAKRVILLASDAQINALRILTLLPPHIAEESDEKMDKLEAGMAKDNTRVRKDIEALRLIPSVNNNADLAKAASSYDRFSTIRMEILKLSRENTNVRSLAISLNQKHKITLLCQDTLNALKQAILEEPVRGVTYGPPARPR
jgi:hypothetical protein